MATITKRANGKYQAKIRVRGKTVASRIFTRKTDASDWAKKIEVQIKEGKYLKNAEAWKHTFAEMIDRYIEDIVPNKFSKKRDQDGAKNHLNWWKNNLGHFLLIDVTPVLLSEYRDKLKKEPYVKYKRTSLKNKAKQETPEEKKDKQRERSNGTVNRYLGTLSSVFTTAVNEWGWVEENPLLKVKKLKEPRGRVRFLSDKERKALLEACKVENYQQDKDKNGKKVTNPSLYIVVAIALTTGARFSEIMNLKWEDIDFNRRLFYFLETKNKERRSVPISQHAYELLQEHKKIRRINTKYVFPGKEGHKPIELKRQWENAIENAGLEDFRFHDLRHTAASYLAMNGASLLDIAHILGHKTLEMTKRYSHLTEQHTAVVLERVNNIQFKNIECNN